MAAKSRHQSRDHEARLSRELEMRLVPGSGCGPYRVGDLVNDSWYLEAKSFKDGRIRFSHGWFTQAKNQAAMIGKKHTVVALYMVTRPVKYTGGRDFFVLDRRPEGVEACSKKRTGDTVRLTEDFLSSIAPGQYGAIVGPKQTHYVVHLKDLKGVMNEYKEEH